MHSHFRFVTSPTADTPGTTLLLHFDNKRYLFGSISEGTQRALVQQGVKTLKISDLFITGRSEWSNVGGLIGMILTLADSSSSSVTTSTEELKKKMIAKLKREGQTDINEAKLAAQLAKEVKEKTRLRIFGPPNLNYLLATARRFVFRKGMPVDVEEFSRQSSAPHGAVQNGPTHSDDNIDVWTLPIVPSPPKITTSSNSSRTASPRKRSYDEVDDSRDGITSTLTDREKTAMMAKSVVSEMFESSWRLDALVETPINEVRLPAALFVKDPETGKTVKYTGPMPGGSQPVPGINVLVRRPWPGALVESLPPTEPAREAISYIVKLHRQRGRFRPQRAIELKVEKGLKWSKLTNGETVLNVDGETITPDMVLEEGKEGNATAIIDLPSEEYVESLVNRPEWKNEEIMSNLCAFIWSLGTGVAASPKLKQFMSSMGQARHIIASSDVCPNRISMDSAAAATVRLMKVDPARYIIPVHDQREKPQIGDEGTILADRGMMVQLTPTFEVREQESSPLLNINKVVSEMAPDVLEAAAEARKSIEDNKAELDDWASRVPQGDAEVITLGTGSALPSKYRNVSATLLRVPGWGSVLLDCGENTLGQLKRMYTESELRDVLHDLRAIWISHMHADHHLGTVSVIRAWFQAVHGSMPTSAPSPLDNGFDPASLFKDQKRLAVISDVPMVRWLHEYSNVEDYGFSHLAPLIISPARPASGVVSDLQWFFANVPSENPTADERKQYYAICLRAKVPASVVGFADIQAVLVQHCHGARAVSITFPSGFKASYSGDCRPSEPFSVIGKGSTVCIHEATFDDELQGDALAKNHTTTSEALGVALAMDAKACVLTHFSQRYQKVPVLEYTDSDDDAIPSYGKATGGVTEDVSTNPDDDMDAPMTDVHETPDAASSTRPLLAGQEAAGSDEAADIPKHLTIKLKKGTEMKVCVAFDLMRVKVGEIAQLEKMTPALIKLFAAEEKEEEVEEGNAKNNQAKAGGAGKGKGKKGGQVNEDGSGKKNKKEKGKRFN
ncbi:hypothetical protein AAFC00_003089 [Neodothiora populina]|uniref:ribonuclease Z n=1 Tax=Neodothiora populina TaxID=2781224 RepID=A0ABR3P9I3_9PEZI